MAIRILYFAGLREALDRSGESIELPPEVTNAEQLRAHLAARGGAWEALQRTKNLRVAVNQRMVEGGVALSDGDEVAFFPPVTGG